MPARKKEKESEPSLTDRVDDAIGSGTLAKAGARHYRAIAKTLDGYETMVDGYTRDLTDALGSKFKNPADLYLALLKHIAAREEIKDADKIASIDDISDPDLDKIRHHLTINYGIPNETDLKKLLDTAAGGNYETEEEVKEAIRSLAHRKGQHEISQRAAAWTSDKEWAAHAGPGGTHHEFMQLVTDFYSPPGAPKEVDTFKRPEEATGYIGNIAQQAYQEKKAARRKV